MRILEVHNHYRSGGGEDTVVALERDLLQAFGHEISLLSVSNVGLEVGRLFTALQVGASTIWSGRGYRLLSDRVREFGPDIVHVHNTFPQLSPSIYWAASRLGVPVVQTLHNYRLTCANGLLLRNSRPCELCVGRVPLAALRYRCYRNSVAATAAVVGMQVTHRVLATYRTKVAAYIALSEFAKAIMVRSGLPEERVYVKPNFLPDPLATSAPRINRVNRVAFVGRLSPEKGVDLLLEAWSRLRAGGWELLIVGDGPEREALKSRFSHVTGVTWRGWQAPERVLRDMQASRFLVMPSRWYETFGMVLIEALAVGTPAIAPRQAGMPEIVTHEESGLLFQPNNLPDLVNALRYATTLDRNRWSSWSHACRARYLERYTPHANYKMLRTIYESVLSRAQT